MMELLKTTNPTTPPFVQALLRERGLECVVFDQNVSSLMGGLPFFPQRIMVADDDYAEARMILWEMRELLPELPTQPARRP